MNKHKDFLVTTPFWFTEFYKSLSERDVFCLKTSAIIAATGKSREYISRLFKKAVGRTLVDYLNACRIEYAKKMLISSSSDIIEISLECGYENLSTFYHLFKSKTGISPKKYRDNCKRL
ncbi:MAG: hypothetical protein BGN88_06065 [Clostridiales bacterium 43-6]|nr:MAG: hypothetical protein BGN88_06065 [Clostridiales bacterium 43-6]